MIKLSQVKSHIGLAVVLLVYLGLTIYTSWRVPLSVGPDEVAHFMLARFLRQEVRLPVSAEDLAAAGYKSDQPPLNSIFIAAAYFWGDIASPPFVKLTHDVPRRHLVLDGLVDHSGRAFHIVNTEDPLAGEFLFWRFGRLMSTIFSGLTLIVIYLTTLKVFEQQPDKTMWALAAVMVVAFIPTFTFISGMFSYENLLGLWLALYLLVAVYIIRGHESGWLFGLAGLLVGLAITTKLAALPAPLTLVIFVSVLAHESAWPVRQYLSRLGLSLLGLLAGAGWWFAWMELTFNRVADLGWFSGLLYPLVNDEVSVKIFYILSHRTLSEVDQISLRETWAWAQDMFHTFWSFYASDQYLPWAVLLGLSVVIGLGLIQVWRRQKDTRPWLALLCLYIGFFAILPFIRLVTTGLVSKAGQGQHVLFPAAGAWAISMMLGMSGWLPARITKQWLGGILLGIGLLVWNVMLVTQTYPQAVPVPVRTVPPLAPASAQQLDVDFGPLALKGYELTNTSPDPMQPALQVNLHWLAQEFMTEDYLITVKLVDRQGQAQSVWTGYNADGHYPSRAWEPGDIVHDELYLPLLGLHPNEYTVNLQVKGKQGPLATKDGLTTLTLTNVDLTTPWPGAKTSAKTYPLSTVEVWQAGQISGSVPEFEYGSTVQVTAEPDGEAQLIGPDQVAHSPIDKAGHTLIFIIEPLWPRGEYYLQTEIGDPIEPLPALMVKGFQREAKIPPVQTEVKANFANYIMLLGYDLPQRNLTAGEPLPLTLYWQALQTTPTDFIMFTRLYDQAGQVWGGYDRWPREYYSPLMWAAGEVVDDGFTVATRPDTPSGLYYLDVGYYLVVGQAPVSLPLIQDGKMSDVTKVSIGPFKIGD